MGKVEILLEFLSFLKQQKKWWLIPIIIILLLFSVIICFTQSSTIAPFVYTLF